MSNDNAPKDQPAPPAVAGQLDRPVRRHTPGPWVCAPAQGDGGKRPKVTTVAHCAGFVIGLPADVEGGNYRWGDPSGDEEADAKLIAAAPELLAFALLVLRGAVSGAIKSHGFVIDDPDAEQLETVTLAVEARRVIALTKV